MPLHVEVVFRNVFGNTLLQVLSWLPSVCYQWNNFLGIQATHRADCPMLTTATGNTDTNSQLKLWYIVQL